MFIPDLSAPSDDDPVLVPVDESDLMPPDEEPASYDVEDEGYDLGAFVGGVVDGAIDSYFWP